MSVKSVPLKQTQGNFGTENIEPNSLKLFALLKKYFEIQ